jgi:hypothetical protein
MAPPLTGAGSTSGTSWPWWLLAEVEQAHAGPASHPKVSAQRCSGQPPEGVGATLLLSPIQQGGNPAKDAIPVSDRRGLPKRFRWRDFFACRPPESSAGTGLSARPHGLREDYGSPKAAMSTLSSYSNEQTTAPAEHHIAPVIGVPALRAVSNSYTTGQRLSPNRLADRRQAQ